mgnify:CR=1 FL=1
MIVHDITERDFINKVLKREKVRVGKGTRFTQALEGSTTSFTASLVFWETTPSADEKSNLVIGKYCSVATNVRFFLGGNHMFDRGSTWLHPNGETPAISSNGDIVIGNDVWIGHGATIMSGVTIGDGAVVGANALVVKDVPAYGIIGGNPAKMIKYRFEKDLCDRMLDIKWWDWSDKKIDAHASLLFGPPITPAVVERLELANNLILAE